MNTGKTSIAAVARRAGLLTLLTAAGLLTGCATSTVQTSKVLAKPTEPIQTLEIVYRENELKPAGLTAKRPPALENVKFYELGKRLQNRAPTYLKTKGIDATVLVIPVPADGGPAVKAPPPKTPRLYLEAVNGRVTQQGLAVRVFLNMISALSEPSTSGNPKTLWSGTFELALGADQAVGIMKMNRVDDQFIDDLLATVIGKLQEDGVIRK